MTTNLKLVASPETKCAECPVRRMALFKKVPADKLAWTQGYRTSQSNIEARHHLYHEGQTHPYVYTLYDGCLKLYKTLANGKVQAMRFASPGDFIGFQGDLTDKMHHGAIAITDCVVCAFPREKVSRMLCEHPEIATELITKNARMQAFCQEHLLSTGARSAIESIAFTLVELNHRLTTLRKFQDSTIFTEPETLPITQEDLADAVGITPIHVNRTLRQLREQDLIFCGKGQIKILDEPALRELANFDPQLCHDADMF